MNNLEFGTVGQLGHFEKTELSHRKVLILLDMGRLGHLGQCFEIWFESVSLREG